MLASPAVPEADPGAARGRIGSDSGNPEGAIPGRAAPGSIERGAEGHPEIVRHAAAAFKARVTGVVRKNRGG